MTQEELLSLAPSKQAVLIAETFGWTQWNLERVWNALHDVLPGVESALFRPAKNEWYFCWKLEGDGWLHRTATCPTATLALMLALLIAKGTILKD